MHLPLKCGHLIGLAHTWNDYFRGLILIRECWFGVGRGVNRGHTY